HVSHVSSSPYVLIHPPAIQSLRHPLTPLTRYSKSKTKYTSAWRHWRRIHSSAAMAPAIAILLFVVCAEHSKKSQRATLSPAGASINAAFPPRLGFVESLPRQLSSACTITNGVVTAE